jgi:hypothetical protein
MPGSMSRYSLFFCILLTAGAVDRLHFELSPDALPRDGWKRIVSIGTETDPRPEKPPR